MFRTFAGGKMAHRADQFDEVIPELSDLDWAERLADEFGKRLSSSQIRFSLETEALKQ